MNKSKIYIRGIVAVLVVAVVVGGLFLSPASAFLGDRLFDSVSDSLNAAQSNEESAPNETSLVIPTERYAVADIVEKVSPAVVRIETRSVSSAGSVNPFFNDPFFKEFFGFDLPDIPQVQQGLGSGFIFDERGYILTNDHVVRGADSIQIVLEDEKEPIKAEVVGSDYNMDLAVLKIDNNKSLPTVPLGDSSTTRVGEWVIAVGNPYGLDHTVTVGVISAKGRPLVIENRHYEELLQTDAAINPGNSGGPLINLNGEVIGINTAVDTASQGIGFAIPINQVKSVLDQLIEKGKVSRPWVGIEITDLDQETAKYLGFSGENGVLVVGVQPNSPAERAGIASGDVILEINGQAMTSADEVVSFIKGRAIGDKLNFKIWRNGKVLSISVTVGDQADQGS